MFKWKCAYLYVLNPFTAKFKYNVLRIKMKMKFVWDTSIPVEVKMLRQILIVSVSWIWLSGLSWCLIVHPTSFCSPNSLCSSQSLQWHQQAFMFMLSLKSSLHCLSGLPISLFCGLVWLLCLMAYQSSWVILCQSHPYRRIVMILCKP